MNRFIHSVCTVTLAMLITASPGLVRAQDYAPTSSAKEPTAEAMLADIFVLRPFGIAATVLGSVAFVVSLPFTLPTRSVDKAAQKLVVDPAKYTFTRPLGHMPQEP
jgi:hypothetical protein